MIYKITLIIEINKKIIDNNYYNILGSIYNILGENDIFKKSILSISNIYKRDDNLCNIKLSINGKDNFNKIFLLIQDKGKINLNGDFFKIKGIDFDFNIFDDNLKFNDYKQFEITYKTPTIVKKEMNGIDINQLLPVPEVFLISAIRKYNNLFQKDLDLEKIKKIIRNNIFIVKFDISTKIIKIKKNTKAGIIGKIKYELLDSIDNNYKIIIYNSLKLANIIGIGTGVKLGLGQVGIYFNNK